MIKIYPLNSNTAQTYYSGLKFSFDPTRLTAYISGTFLNTYIQKYIAIDKKSLLISNTTLFKSFTVLYTYLTIDLNNYTYISSITKPNLTDPYKPVFLIFLDPSLNSINDAINTPNLVDAETTYISTTSTINTQTNSSISSNISNLAHTSLTALYSLTAEYCKNIPSINTADNNNSKLLNIPYTRIFVSTSLIDSSTIYEYDSLYNIQTKELFVFANNIWQKVNWQDYIKSDRLYKEGILRINPSTSALEIQSTNKNWNEIIPTIGNAFEPIEYINYVYYIAPGQIYNGFSSYVAPIIAVNNMMFSGMIFNNNQYASEFGNNEIDLYPSGLLINDGCYGILSCDANNNNNVFSDSNYQFIPVIIAGDSIEYFNNIKLFIANNKLAIISFDFDDHYGYIQAKISYGTFPNSGYYLGTWHYKDLHPIDFINVTIKREL